MHRPKLLHRKFDKGIQEYLAERGNKLPPTFLFVDPCGVAGTSFQTIKQVMSFKSSEAFIFYNIAGVKRIVGTNKLGPALLRLMGSKERGDEMLALSGERQLLDCYLNAVQKDMGMKFTIPFRIEFEDKKLTGHYLIHASKNELGFAIMKDVMWMRGRSADGQGSFEFTQASHTGVRYLSLFKETRKTRRRS